jgi:ABC-2 type transport system ATP-binding protein
MPSATPVLRAQRLVKAFKDRVAVDHLDLVLEAGDRVGLLGPNGAGKTTTLLMILGAIKPDAGSIDLAGHRLPHGRSKAMEQVGFVAGYLPLPENLTVREALSLFAGFAGIRKPETVVERAIAEFALDEMANKRNQELSSGQRTLVSIAKATLHQPRLLVLDEPTASLDPDIAARVRSSLLELHQRHNTALLVTSHNMREVEALCERVVLMSTGRIVADGSPGAIAQQFDVDDLEGAFLKVAAELRGPR